MESLLQDLRYAVRALGRAPGFTVAAVLALALGIGANTAIFSTVDAVLLRPPPFREGDRLVVVWEQNLERGARYNEVSAASYRALRERARTLEQVAAWDFAGFTLGGDGPSERVDGIVLAPHLLSMLGVAPARGRDFADTDAQPGAPPVIMLGHGFWQRRFAGEPNIVGTTVSIEGAPATIIGVMPEGFHFGATADVYAPLAISEAGWQDHRTRWLRLVGRLAPGASHEAAARELASIAADLESRRPADDAGWDFSVHAFNEGMVQGPIRPMLLFQLGAVAFVLLIACADVANLLLARATERIREVAVRAALGAGRARVLRQLMTESIVLGLAGGTLGVLFAVWGIEALRSGLPPVALEFTPSLRDIGVDGRVLGFTLGVSLATGAAFGIVPALRATRIDLAAAMQTVGRGATAGRDHGRLRAALVAAEVALALALLTGGTVLMRGFAAQLAANPAFRTDDVVVQWLQAPDDLRQDRDRLLALHRQLDERVGELPSVEAAGLTVAYPLSGEEFRPPVRLEASAAEGDLPAVGVRMVTPGYLGTIGVPIVAGRGIETTDRDDAAPVAVVSRSFARRSFPDGNAIGNRIRIQGDSAREIVGIAENIEDWRLASRDQTTVYVPLAQFPTGRVAIVARARGDAATTIRDIRDAAHALLPAEPVFGARTMRDVLDEAVAGQRIGAWMMAVFAAVALLLAIVGVYGVTAYSVAQRAHELALRVALGARSRDIRSLVLTQGMKPVLAGLLAGMLLSAAIARALAGFAGADTGSSALTVAASAAILALAAAAALVGPIRRAGTVDPLSVVRSD